jgi:hypothetical protein
MGLPGAERADVEPRKVTDYLLSSVHPVGRHKARFFRALGFSLGQADELRGALLRIARHGTVSSRVVTAFGTRYIVDGVVETPAGISVALRTVWIIPQGSGRPEFVTAFPRRRGGKG